MSLANGDRLSGTIVPLEALDGRLLAEDSLLQARTGVRLPVGNGLGLATQLNADYDAVPAAGKESADTMVIFKLDYLLHCTHTHGAQSASVHSRQEAEPWRPTTQPGPRSRPATAGVGGSPR